VKLTSTNAVPRISVHIVKTGEHVTTQSGHMSAHVLRVTSGQIVGRQTAAA